jgi:hypothetical protein
MSESIAGALQFQELLLGDRHALRHAPPRLKIYCRKEQSYEKMLILQKPDSK